MCRVGEDLADANEQNECCCDNGFHNFRLKVEEKKDDLFAIVINDSTKVGWAVWREK
jgi:hypothetical protein